MLYLSLLIWIPIVASGLVLLPIFSRGNKQIIASLSSVISLFIAYQMFIHFDLNSSAFQLQELFNWIPVLNAHYSLGVDGITFALIILTIIMHSVIVITAPKLVNNQYGSYLAVFLSLQGITIGVFSALDNLLFYFFWEAMLIPMYLCIGIWGGEAKNYASIKFFLYTFLGSALLLVSILYLGVHAQSFAWVKAVELPLNLTVQKLLFIGFFMAFAVKVPMWPVHTWLPDAHTEAPAAGSVILAALMLKVGAYGFFRFCLPILPDASQFFAPYIIILSLIAVIYIGLVALAQTDMKKLIAYSSIAHMGFVTLGCFIVYALNGGDFARLAIEGAIMQMVAHGFGSGAMFLAFGLLYERYHTRKIDNFGGIAKVMPVFSACFMIFALTNVGLPGTAGFVGEFTVILGVFQASPLYATLAGMTLIIGAAYTLWMFKRVFYGPIIKEQVAELVDVTMIEKATLLFLVVCIFALGLYPEIVLKSTHASVVKLTEYALHSKFIG